MGELGLGVVGSMWVLACSCNMHSPIWGCGREGGGWGAGRGISGGTKWGIRGEGIMGEYEGAWWRYVGRFGGCGGWGVGGGRGKGGGGTMR